VTLEFKEQQPVVAEVMWAKYSEAGIEFEQPIDVLELLKASDGPRPRMPRVEVRASGFVRQGAQLHRMVVNNISQGGISTQCAAELQVGGEVTVTLARFAAAGGRQMAAFRRLRDHVQRRAWGAASNRVAAIAVGNGRRQLTPEGVRRHRPLLDYPLLGFGQRPRRQPRTTFDFGRGPLSPGRDVTEQLLGKQRLVEGDSGVVAVNPGEGCRHAKPLVMEQDSGPLRRQIVTLNERPVMRKVAQQDLLRGAGNLKRSLEHHVGTAGTPFSVARPLHGPTLKFSSKRRFKS
jgi:hypothetical protein